MARHMRTSETGLELIRSFEGFRARASALPDGRWIIGYGHTASARKGLTVTHAEADLVLRHYDLKRVEQLIGDHVLAPLSQNEFDALVSFVFNIGLAAFLKSDVLVFLNSGERLLAADAMTAWRKGRVQGKVRVIDALVRRRAAERALFLEHSGGRAAIPGALIRPQLDPSVSPKPARDQAMLVEARTRQDETHAVPVQDPARGPQAAARSVTQRLTRILEESGGAGAPEEGTGVEDITRAISALAETETGERPEDRSERRQTPRHTPLPPTAPQPSNGARKVISDIETVEPDPEQIARAEREARFNDLSAVPLAELRWLPFALLSGLGLVGLIYGIARFASLSADGLPADVYFGPLVALGSGFLSIVSVYYLHRVLTGRV